MKALFDATELMHVFPTLLWRADLKPTEFEPLNSALLETLTKMGAPQQMRPGQNWQSDHDLHVHLRLKTLLSYINAAGEHLLDYMKTEGSLALTGCWANVAAPGAGHRLHSHRNNFLSGVYYVQVQEGANTINFYDPRPQAGVIRPIALEPTAENTEVASVRVTNGTLMLFPGWLQHSVDINRSAAQRISISFNLMFRDFEKWRVQLGRRA